MVIIQTKLGTYRYLNPNMNREGTNKKMISKYY